MIKAVQQIMLGTVTGTERKAYEALERICKAGYTGIELNGFMLRPTSFVVRALTKAAGMPVGRGGKLNWEHMIKQSGLKVVSVHEDLGTVTRTPDMVTAEAERFGTQYVVITGMYRFDYSDRSAVQGLAESLNRAGEQLKRDGISLLYHNHSCEFRKLEDGRTAYEWLLNETSPEYVNFEYDSYWPADAGVDALAWMKRLGNRMKLYHINDRGARLTGPSMTPIMKCDSCELGDGNMELRSFVEQAKAVQVDSIILESHRNWVDGSPLKSMERSALFMKQYV